LKVPIFLKKRQKKIKSGNFLPLVKGLGLGPSGFEAPLIRSLGQVKGQILPASNPEGPKARSFSYTS
jgi:hypothetical protein